MVTLLFSWILGGLALRAVARTHEMLKPENRLNQPAAFRGPLIPRLEAIGFWFVFLSALLLGWHRSGWIGVILQPIEIYVASLVFDWLIGRLPKRIQWSMFLNPFAHLYVSPYCFFILAVTAFLAA